MVPYADGHPRRTAGVDSHGFSNAVLAAVSISKASRCFGGPAIRYAVAGSGTWPFALHIRGSDTRKLFLWRWSPATRFWSRGKFIPAFQPLCNWWSTRELFQRSMLKRSNPLPYLFISTRNENKNFGNQLWRGYLTMSLGGGKFIKSSSWNTFL